MMIWIPTAAKISTTLSGVLALTPALAKSTRAAPTIRISPSTSKPSWVSQLKKAGNFEPWGPNAARLMPNTVVPVWGPWSEQSPTKNHERFPMMIRLSACQNEKPNPIRIAP